MLYEVITLARADMKRLETLAVFARADSHERDAVTVSRVHVRLDLEHETGESVVLRCHRSGIA